MWISSTAGQERASSASRNVLTIVSGDGGCNGMVVGTNPCCCGPAVAWGRSWIDPVVKTAVIQNIGARCFRTHLVGRDRPVLDVGSALDHLALLDQPNSGCRIFIDSWLSL